MKVMYQTCLRNIIFFYISELIVQRYSEIFFSPQVDYQQKGHINITLRTKRVPETKKDLPAHDEQSLLEDYKPKASMSRSRPGQFQLGP